MSRQTFSKLIVARHKKWKARNRDGKEEEEELVAMVTS
jgi:hypothetical protein